MFIIVITRDGNRLEYYNRIIGQPQPIIAACKLTLMTPAPPEQFHNLKVKLNN